LQQKEINESGKKNMNENGKKETEEVDISIYRPE
jgi:hypothetical protein